MYCVDVVNYGTLHCVVLCIKIQEVHCSMERLCSLHHIIIIVVNVILTKIVVTILINIIVNTILIMKRSVLQCEEDLARGSPCIGHNAPLSLPIKVAILLLLRLVILLLLLLLTLVIIVVIILSPSYSLLSSFPP